MQRSAPVRLILSTTWTQLVNTFFSSSVLLGGALDTTHSVYLLPHHPSSLFPWLFPPPLHTVECSRAWIWMSSLCWIILGDGIQACDFGSHLNLMTPNVASSVWNSLPEPHIPMPAGLLHISNCKTIGTWVVLHPEPVPTANPVGSPISTDSVPPSSRHSHLYLLVQAIIKLCWMKQPFTETSVPLFLHFCSLVHENQRKLKALLCEALKDLPMSTSPLSNICLSPDPLQFFPSFSWLLYYWCSRTFLEHAEHISDSGLLFPCILPRIVVWLPLFLQSSFQIIPITKVFSKNPYKISTLFPMLPDACLAFFFSTVIKLAPFNLAFSPCVTSPYLTLPFPSLLSPSLPSPFHPSIHLSFVHPVVLLHPCKYERSMMMGCLHCPTPDI